MSQKCPICPDIIWDMCYSMLIISGLLLSKFYCTHPIPPETTLRIEKVERAQGRGKKS